MSEIQHWRIVGGPDQLEVDWSARCWRWTLESIDDGSSLHLWVYVTDSSFSGDAAELPSVTRLAIESLGRSEVEAQLVASEPRRRTVLTRNGYGEYPEGHDW